MMHVKESELTEAIEQFDAHEQRDDGAHVARSLCSGLSLLSDLLYDRMHFDVEKNVGMDSMLVPVSEMRTLKETKKEIELFQVVESSWAAKEYGYLASGGDWYTQWLGRLRLGELFSEKENAEQVAEYRSKKPDDRRLALIDVLLEVLPESRRAPLVLFRLVPLAVHVVTALAFGDQATASEVRQSQIACLPSIRDCHQCHGAVMDNEEICAVCGSPLWRFEWLEGAD